MVGPTSVLPWPSVAIVRPPMACCGLIPRRAAIRGAMTGGRGRPAAPARSVGAGGAGFRTAAPRGRSLLTPSPDPELLPAILLLLSPPPLPPDGAGDLSPGFHALVRSGVPLPPAAAAAAPRACAKISSMRIPVPSSHSAVEPPDSDLFFIENSISSPATEEDVEPRLPAARRGAAPRGPWPTSGGVGTRLPPGELCTNLAVRRLLYSSSAGDPRPASEPDPLLPDSGRSDALEAAPMATLPPPMTSLLPPLPCLNWMAELPRPPKTPALPPSSSWSTSSSSAPSSI